MPWRRSDLARGIDVALWLFGDHRRAMHIAIRAVIGHRKMHRAAIVPNDQIALLPAVAIQELIALAVLIEEAENRVTLSLVKALKVGRKARVDIKNRLACLRVTDNNRMNRTVLAIEILCGQIGLAVAAT
jgi:hypothetical protein